ISPDMSEGAFSPLSLVRWGLLVVFAAAAWRMKTPVTFHVDTVLSAAVILMLVHMLTSSLYADSFSYSFMRGLSFAVLAFGLMKGLSGRLFSSVNCLHFFRLKYYTAWITIAPMFILLVTGIGYGVTIIMNQYAGLFGNQNMFGTFSALISPYVVFHWRVVAQKRRGEIVGGLLLGQIFGCAGVFHSLHGL